MYINNNHNFQFLYLEKNKKEKKNYNMLLTSICINFLLDKQGYSNPHSACY